MSTQNEISKIKKQGAALKYAVLSIAVISITFSALKYGNELGYKAGWQDAQVAVQKYLVSHQRATIFEDPGHQVLAMVQNGACFPFPSRIPEIHNPTVWVSEQWMPCSPRTIAPYIHPLQALAAITRAVQR